MHMLMKLCVCYLLMTKIVQYRNGNSKAALAFCLKDRRSSDAMRNARWALTTATASACHWQCHDVAPRVDHSVRIRYYTVTSGASLA